MAPKLPLRLERFTLCEELGAGGMATVYLTRMSLAAGIERLVALKTIHPHLARERPFVNMFLDEARIASHVSHPNVCATYDFGEVDGVYYLAMEYLLGEPLFDVINRIVDRFEETREVLPFLAARVIADACEGLHAAHSARGPDGEILHIVHRDVSPQNLFLTYDGTTKVVDFGCAKAAERVAHTSTGVMKGKVGYAAPEQLRSDHVDARADVWALGVCLWETLTLSPLFSRETAVKTAMAVLQDPIELASEGRDWVPEEVARIAAKALSRDREERYASARDLSRDLRRFIADSGFSLESAELAEWMDFLFDERHEERVAQASRVREMDLSDVSTAPLYEVTDDDVESLDSSAAALMAVPLDDNGDPIPDASGPVLRQDEHEDEDEGSPREGFWLFVLVLVLVLAGGAWYLYANYEPTPWLLELVGMEEPQAAYPPPPPPAPEEPRPEEEEEPPLPTLPDLTRDEPAQSGDTEAEEPEPEAEPDPETSGARPRQRPERPVVTTVVSGGGPPAHLRPPTPTAPTPRTQPAAASTGFLSIQTSGGWALVYEGGRQLGRTPLHQELPPGRHRLRILPYGQEPAQSLTVTIEAGLEESFTIDVVDPGAP